MCKGREKAAGTTIGSLQALLMIEANVAFTLAQRITIPAQSTASSRHDNLRLEVGLRRCVPFRVIPGRPRDRQFSAHRFLHLSKSIINTPVLATLGYCLRKWWKIGELTNKVISASS
jgi:hypothetical protein